MSDSVEFFQKDLRQLIDATNDAFSLGLSESDTPIELIDGFIGEGYAIPYPAALETLRHVAQREGLLLDPTYTAKAMHWIPRNDPHRGDSAGRRAAVCPHRRRLSG